MLVLLPLGLARMMRVATVERARPRDPRGLQPGLRRWRTTTPSSRTGRWSRRCAARAPIGRRTRLSELGALCGLPQTIRWGFEANENPPKLRTHDRFGNRIDEVEFHPAWHELMRIGIGHGLHALALARPAAGRPRRARRAVHAPRPGRGGGGLPDLDDLLGDPGAANPARAGRAEWEPRFLSLSYDGERLVPGAGQAGGALRDGHDREAGRLRRSRQHHHRPAAERRRARAASTRSPGTSGSSRRRCATPSSSSPRPTAACRASCSPASRPTASATASTSSD